MHKFVKQLFGGLLIMISLFFLGACGPASPTPTPAATETRVSPAPTATMVAELSDTAAPAPTEATDNPSLADVSAVEVRGSANAYTFAVEIRSPDTGCNQYANWWEVITEDGELIYRRILAHSHVSEQPFTRSGGPVNINADTVVIVRAHMDPDGYGGQAFRGSVQGGFEVIQLETDFASDLEHVEPLPDGCAF